MSMHAPIKVAFTWTSKSIGKWILKKSASVKHSRQQPDHFFVILPTWSPFNIRICHLDNWKLIVWFDEKFIFMIYPKIDAGATTWWCEKWAFNSQNRFIVWVFDAVVWKQGRPFLFDTSNELSGWYRYFNRLETAWKTAAWTSQWTMKMNNFIFVQIQDLHIKWTTIATTISHATICIFSNHKNLVQKQRSNWIDEIYLQMLFVFFLIDGSRDSSWFCIKLTFWSTLFFTMYLLLISYLHITSHALTFCSITNWSRVLRYSRPCGQWDNPFGELMWSSEHKGVETKIMKTMTTDHFSIEWVLISINEDSNEIFIFIPILLIFCS